MKLQSIPDSEIAERQEYSFRITQLIREGEITEYEAAAVFDKVFPKFNGCLGSTRGMRESEYEHVTSDRVSEILKKLNE